MIPISLPCDIAFGILLPISASLHPQLFLPVDGLLDLLDPQVRMLVQLPHLESPGLAACLDLETCQTCMCEVFVHKTSIGQVTQRWLPAVPVPDGIPNSACTSPHRCLP